MGKTIKLTEEQIRRFFGEGFGKRLIGEGADTITNDSPGRATYTGNLNRARFDYTGGKDSDLTTAARANKQQLGNSRMSQYTVNDILKNNKENTGGMIDEIVKQIFAETNQPVNIIDLLKLLNNAMTQESIKGLLDSVDIVTILSGFIGLNAPDYVYMRLMNLTPEQLDTIEKRFGKDFKDWGSKCDGCGAVGWKTTVPIAEHDEAYTTFDFGATSDADLAQSGYSIKESKTNTAGFKPREISFKDYKILEMHHINGDASNNSAYNVACLCPNCHSCIDSTSKGKTIDFGKDFILNNGEIRGDSILGKMSDREQEYFKKTVVDRVMHGYYSDRALSTAAMYGNNGEYTDIISKKLERLNIPPYLDGEIDMDVFAESLSQAVENARNFAISKGANSENLYRTLGKSDKEYNTNKEEIDEATQKNYKLYLNKARKGVAGGTNLSVEYTFAFTKDEAVMKVKGVREAPEIIIINHLGDENQDIKEVSNIIDRIIMACFDALSNVVALRKSTKQDLAMNVKSGEGDAFISRESPETHYGMPPIEILLVRSLNPKASGAMSVKGKFFWGENVVKRVMDALRSVYGGYGSVDGKILTEKPKSINQGMFEDPASYRMRVANFYKQNGYNVILSGRGENKTTGLWCYAYYANDRTSAKRDKWDLWYDKDEIEKVIQQAIENV